MKRMLMTVALLLMVTGCATKNVHPAFYDMVKDHKVLLIETNDAVIDSIQAELNDARDRLTNEQVKAIENLIVRLEFLKAQGMAIEKYVDAEYADPELISELISLRWMQGL